MRYIGRHLKMQPQEMSIVKPYHSLTYHRAYIIFDWLPALRLWYLLLSSSGNTRSEHPVRPVVTTGRQHLPLKLLQGSHFECSIKLSHIAEIL